MKSNFVVSAFREIWLPESRRIFAIDPYIEHVLEREGVRSSYGQVDVAPLMRTTREALEADHAYVDAKFKKYTELLVARLDEVHGTEFGPTFWRKAMALSLLRHVTFCYDLYQVCEANLDVNLHDCRILDESAFRIPFDFDEHRIYFEQRDLGVEQLFSIYCQMFYPGYFDTWRPQQEAAAGVTSLTKITGEKSFLTRAFGKILGRIKATLQNPTVTLKALVIKVLRIRSPNLAIMACSFAQEHMERLQIGSHGLIQAIDLPEITSGNGYVEWGLRERIVRDSADFDLFDRFVFASLRQGMPKIFVEDFSKVYHQLDRFFQKYNKLRWVVSEWWIGQNYSALALAVLQSRGVRHIYSEHNCLSYFFVGTNIKYLVALVDEYLTLGWMREGLSNLVRGASLYPWKLTPDPVREIDLLLVLGVPLAHRSEANAVYGNSGSDRAIRYIRRTRQFLSSLGEESLGELYIRSYPKKEAEKWMVWSQDFELAQLLQKVKAYDETSENSARQLMQKSRMNIFNYFGTSFMEALISDFPSVLILDRDTLFLQGDGPHLFDVLEKVGICHFDPGFAAQFVNSIKSNPEMWWTSSPVQSARQEFLKLNIGDSEIAIQYLLSKSLSIKNLN